MPGLIFVSKESSLHRDGLVRARVDADAALGAVIGTSENRNVLEVVAALWALIYADTTSGAQVLINNRYRHVPSSFPHGGFAAKQCGHDSTLDP